MKKLAYLLILVPLVAGGWMITDRATFHREQWLADFEQLKTAVEQQYANLQWARTSKDVDLVALHAAATAQLQQATTQSQARHAIERFIAGFHDGHFHLRSAQPRPFAAVLRLFKREQAPAIELAMSGADACRALGFKRTGHKLDIDDAAVLPATTFAAGLVTTDRGRKFGIIRIPLFQQREYGEVCERVWATFSGARVGDCDEACQNEFHDRAKHEIAQALADDAHALQAAGAEAVVIDLTGNGGGTEWAEYAAAALSAQPLESPAVAFVRTPHWEQRFAGDLAWLEEQLGQAQTAEERDRFNQARSIASAMRDSARTRCELRELWHDRNFQPTCWNVIRAAPNSLPQFEQQYQRPYDGPLYIMTDRHTASASEQFAATLQDNGVASTIGETTMGVGCGYTNGGDPVTLKHSGLVVWLPDCVRLRRDGSNEFEGVRADYPVDWGNDVTARKRALFAVLDRSPKRQ